jgi:hypothetical protein
VIILGSGKRGAPKAQANNIKVVAKNKPTKEASNKRVKELSEFLSKTWYVLINSK